MDFFVIFQKRGLGFLKFIPSLFSRKLICVLLFFVFSAQAVKIRFPDEELSSESVLPLVDPVQMVSNRNIPLKYRPELSLSLGFGLDEPFYFSIYPRGAISFHITEVHAISLSGTYFFPLLSSSLERGGHESIGIGEPLKNRFNPLKAPYPQMSVFLNYQYSPYYGKISLSKSWVMNLSIYGFTGLGLLITNQNNQLFAGNMGIGQKLYFNKWLGIRGDLGFYGYYGPAVAKLLLDKSVVQIPYKQLKPEERRININFIANIGVIILI